MATGSWPMAQAHGLGPGGAQDHTSSELRQIGVYILLVVTLGTQAPELPRLAWIYLELPGPSTILSRYIAILYLNTFSL